MAATAAGVVGHTATVLVSDHPVCGAKVDFAEIFLMPQPPLLTRRGINCGLIYIPFLLGGFLGSLVVWIPKVQMAILTGFVDALDRMKQGILVLRVNCL